MALRAGTTSATLFQCVGFELVRVSQASRRALNSPEWVVVETVTGERVSGPKFPGNREFSREFSKISPRSGSESQNTISDLSHLQPNSLRARAGNYFGPSREFQGAEQGNEDAALVVGKSPRPRDRAVPKAAGRPR